MPNAFIGLGSSGPYVPNYLQDEIQFRIDNDLRTIAIPADGVVLGVVGDKNVNHVNFQMPAWYNGFDMSQFQARINFIDAAGNANYYTVTDMTVMTPEGEEVEGTPDENDIIYFTWLVDSYATGYVGQVKFNVRLTKFTGTTLSQAFNTQVNSCQVLEGIQLADEITQEQAEDILFHMTAELQDITDSLKEEIEAKAENSLAEIPDDYTTLYNTVVGLGDELHGDFTISPGIFNGNRRLESDGSYSTTAGYRVFDTLPEVTGGDKICVMLTTKNMGLHEAEIRYMYSTADYPLTTTYNSALSSPSQDNYVILDVPTGQNIAKMFMSFSSAVADKIHVFRMNKAMEIFLAAFGSIRGNLTSATPLVITMPLSLESFSINTLHRIQPDPNIVVSWLPSDYPYDGTANYLMRYHNTLGYDDFYTVIIYDSNMRPIYKKQIEAGTDYGWSRITTDASTTYPNVVLSSGASMFVGDDIHDIVPNKMYCIQLTEELDGLPDDFPYDGNRYFITNYQYNVVEDSNRKDSTYCIYNSAMQPIYYQQYEGDTGYDWHKVTNGGGSSTSGIGVNEYAILTERVSTFLGTSIHDMAPNTLYRLQLTSPLSGMPSDYPYDGNTYYGYNAQFKIAELSDRIDGTYYLFNTAMQPIYYKQYEGSTIYSWHSVSNSGSSGGRTTYTVGASGCTYTKLTDAMAAALAAGHVDIVVKPGTYNIINELGLYSYTGPGPQVGNDTNIFFEQGALVICNYEGTDNNIKSQFSPFNSAAGGFTLENLVIQASNVRYCVHDERAGDTSPYCNKYINCNMYLDNSGNSAWDSPQCIGGGLGKYGYIVIEGGVYNSLPEDKVGWYGAISYHNAEMANTKSHIILKDILFKNSTARFGYYGASTTVTDIEMSNCHCSTEPTLRPETTTSANVNMAVTYWNNDVKYKVANKSDIYSLYERSITLSKSDLGLSNSNTIDSIYVNTNAYTAKFTKSATTTSDGIKIDISNVTAGNGTDIPLYISVVYH